MKADTSVTITPAHVQEWEKEAKDFEKQAEALMLKAKARRAKAKAAAFLLGIGHDLAEVAEGEEPAQQPMLKDLGLAEPHSPGNMVEAMATIANASEHPLTKAQMKSRLRVLGFTEDRLGNYFYTCVARLKGKRITVMDDGKIWKAGAD